MTINNFCKVELENNGNALSSVLLQKISQKISRVLIRVIFT